jgi:hypothetical protein
MGQHSSKLLTVRPDKKLRTLPCTAHNFIRSDSTLPVKSPFNAENYQPGKTVPVHIMKAYGEESVWTHSFSASALDGGESCSLWNAIEAVKGI